MLYALSIIEKTFAKVFTSSKQNLMTGSIILLKVVGVFPLHLFLSGLLDFVLSKPFP